MSDLYSLRKKTKLITLRMSPEVYQKINEMKEQYNAAESRWYYNRKTVSKMLCMAIEDFINGNQKQREDFDKTVKSKKKK